jgi:hypothetical protein
MSKATQVSGLLKAAQTNIVEAIRVVNGGQIPQAQDVAELMAAWGQINAVMAVRFGGDSAKIYAAAQRAMRDTLLEAA